MKCLSNWGGDVRKLRILSSFWKKRQFWWWQGALLVIDVFYQRPTWVKLKINEKLKRKTEIFPFSRYRKTLIWQQTKQSFVADKNIRKKRLTTNEFFNEILQKNFRCISFASTTELPHQMLRSKQQHFWLSGKYFTSDKTSAQLPHLVLQWIFIKDSHLTYIKAKHSSKHIDFLHLAGK